MSTYDMMRMATAQQGSAMQIAQSNNLFNQKESQKQRDFERALFREGNEFNAAEAAKKQKLAGNYV